MDPPARAAARPPSRRRPQTCAMRLTPVFYGWVVLAASCFLFLASIVGHTTGINMAVPHFIEEFGMSRTSISVMWLCAMVTSALLLPVAGAFVDRFGSRRVVHLAMVPYVAVVAATGMVQSVPQLALCAVLLRFLGPEVLTLVASITPNKWFLKRRGRVAAVLSIADASLAGFAPFFQMLIDAYGWRHAYLVLSGVFACLLLVPALLLQSDPRDWEGMHVDGVPPGSGGEGKGNDDGSGSEDTARDKLVVAARDVEEDPSGEKLQRQGLVASTAAATAGKEGGVGGGDGDGGDSDRDEGQLTFCEVLRMREFWAVAVTCAVMNIYWSGFNYHAVGIMSSLAGLSADQTAVSIFLPLTISIGTSAFVMGMCIDGAPVSRLVHVLFASYILLAGTMVGVLYVSTPAAAVLYATVNGIGCGGYQSLMMPMYANLFGTKHLGKIQGVGMGLGVASCGLGPVLFGLSFDHWGTFTPPIVGAAVALTACSCSLLTLRPPGPGDGGGGGGGGASAVVGGSAGGGPRGEVAYEKVGVCEDEA